MTRVLAVFNATMLNAAGALFRSEVIDVSRLLAESPGFPAQILRSLVRTLEEAEMAEATRRVIVITRNGRTTDIGRPMVALVDWLLEAGHQGRVSATVPRCRARAIALVSSAP
jgi:hypothetical protein